MDYLASAISIAAFTLLMNLWVHAPVQGAESVTSPIVVALAR